jgi:hypothetical protein
MKLSELRLWDNLRTALEFVKKELRKFKEEKSSSSLLKYTAVIHLFFFVPTFSTNFEQILG